MFRFERKITNILVKGESAHFDVNGKTRLWLGGETFVFVEKAFFDELARLLLIRSERSWRVDGGVVEESLQCCGGGPGFESRADFKDFRMVTALIHAIHYTIAFSMTIRYKVFHGLFYKELESSHAGYCTYNFFIP